MLYPLRFHPVKITSYYFDNVLSEHAILKMDTKTFQLLSKCLYECSDLNVSKVSLW